MKKLSIIIPIYFNELNLNKTYDVLKKYVLDKLPNLGFDYEIICIDDGSKDRSFEILKELKSKNDKIKIIKLSRNFGSINASLAGIYKSSGDCLSLLSADLQDPPAIIIEMLEKWQEGYKTCIASRQSRNDPIISKFFSNLFYKIFRKIALKDMPSGGFDLFLIDRQVIDLIKNSNEKNSSFLGQIIWSGFKTFEIKYTRQKREDGKSRWTFAKKFKYFIDYIVAFSYTPIRFVSIFGIFISFCSFIYLAVIIYNYFNNNIEIRGWASIFSLILFTSGVQMASIGIIGEYIWRSLDQTRNRPNYIIDEIIE
jgi:dolichol-phosphate mannosyltransferase